MWIARLFIALLFLPSLSYAFCFDEAGNVHGINPILLQGIAKIESNLNPNAINKNLNGSIDMGLMQVNSAWIASLGLDSDMLLSDPCYNVTTGARILKLCIDRHGYTWEAVGCYNALSRQKRVDYSWKVFNMLKKERIRQNSENRIKNKDNKSTHPIQCPTKNSELISPNSSLLFSMKDNAAIN